ncbi:MAG: electron transport complex subunit RsxA [Crocinitomicaceae bacterium]|nr:electron transport complex subunit RsxA [Crocinitomicaceae bacterium]|tara:strand:+ start:5588 stop:6175 length:588 start_codon:yes stop_codon:yes gene_type:complete
MGSNENILFIFVSALLINNFTLAYFLGLCPFLGVSGKIITAFRLGLANIFVMLITSICAYVLNTWVLPYAPYLRLISFIIVIASTVQFVEMAIKKVSPELFKALGIFLPLITTNCAILGLALFQTNKGYGFGQGLVYALGAGAGVTLALVLLAGVREETRILNIPKVIEGAALNLIIAGIISMGFMGFAGLFSGG